MAERNTVPAIVVSSDTLEFTHTFQPPLEEEMIFPATLDSREHKWAAVHYDISESQLNSIAYIAQKGKEREFLEDTLALGQALGRHVTVAAMQNAEADAA